MTGPDAGSTAVQGLPLNHCSAAPIGLLNHQANAGIRRSALTCANAQPLLHRSAGHAKPLSRSACNSPGRRNPRSGAVSWVVGGDGFEPSKAEPTVLQPSPIRALTCGYTEFSWLSPAILRARIRCRWRSCRCALHPARPVEPRLGVSIDQHALLRPGYGRTLPRRTAQAWLFIR